MFDIGSQLAVKTSVKQVGCHWKVITHAGADDSITIMKGAERSHDAVPVYVEPVRVQRSILNIYRIINASS